MIGERTAEEIKIKTGSAWPLNEELTIEVRGRDLITGLPKFVKVTSEEIREALQVAIKEIVDAAKVTLERTPPELAADVMDKGMVMSGGSSLLRNLDQLISKTIGVPCYLADEPLLCVVKGTGMALENLDLYKRTMMMTK